MQLYANSQVRRRLDMELAPDTSPSLGPKTGSEEFKTPKAKRVRTNKSVTSTVPPLSFSPTPQRSNS